MVKAISFKILLQVFHCASGSTNNFNQIRPAKCVLNCQVDLPDGTKYHVQLPVSIRHRNFISKA